MKTTRAWAAALCGLMLTGQLLALTDKEQAALTRVEKNVQLVETSLEKKKTSVRGLQTGFVTSSLKKLADAREDLASLPQEPPVRALIDKLAKLESELSATADEHKSDAAASEGLLQSPDYDSDREQFLALGEIYKSVNGLDANGQLYTVPAFTFRVQRLNQILADIVASGQQFEQLQEKWEPVMTVRDGRASFMAQAIREAVKEQEKYRAAVDSFESSAPGKIESQLQAASAGSAEAVAAKSYDLYMSKAAAPLTSAESLLSTLKVLGFSDPGLTAKVNQAQSTIGKNEKILGDALIAKNKGPADTYTGPDRGTIESVIKGAWKNRYPDRQVLAVRMPNSWSRESGWKWDTTRKAWRRYDESTVQVYAIIATSPTVAQWQWHWVNKYHLNGDRIGTPPFSIESPSPKAQMLRSNL